MDDEEDIKTSDGSIDDQENSVPVSEIDRETPILAINDMEKHFTYWQGGSASVGYVCLINHSDYVEKLRNQERVDARQAFERVETEAASQGRTRLGEWHQCCAR